MRVTITPSSSTEVCECVPGWRVPPRRIVGSHAGFLDSCAVMYLIVNLWVDFSHVTPLHSFQQKKRVVLMIPTEYS